MRLFLSGFGTIGQGFMEACLMKKPLLESMFKEELTFAGVVDSKTYEANPSKNVCLFGVLGNKSNIGTVSKNQRNGKSCIELMEQCDFDILVEATPTDVTNGGEGLNNIKWALENGKDVITVNKGPLALEFASLNKLAEDNGCLLKYEGTVGGAMPIINMCHYGLAGTKIKSIRGIFNGTCNYILSRMDNGLPFQQALKEAQQLGYAETDPTYDIEGYDTASKIVILANSVFKRDVKFSDVSISGITSITPEAIALAAEDGMVIRLIGEVSSNRLVVSPRLVPKGHQLSTSGTLNTALIDTESGPIGVSGRGAGKKETAAAMISDLIDISRSKCQRK